MEIHSSYRFIPVEKDQRYFSPNWKNEVCQDVPFANSVSGTIDYTLTANTAIFVKGSDGKFCQINGKYFIPGSTLKGCVRSVLEIMSFGHLDETRIKDSKEKFPFRDIQDQSGYMRAMSTVYCGWLTDDGHIIHWGQPVHIKYDEIITKIRNCNFGIFRNSNCFEKYLLTANTYLNDRFSNPQRLNGAKPYDKRLFCHFENNGWKGTVIFSGAMQNKKSDFVLLEKDEHSSNLNVPANILNDFKEIYPDYSRVPFNTEKGGRAVFFTLDRTNNVVSLGLSYLHKYYAKNNITDAVPIGMKGNDPDLADVIFGSVKHNLKGRVQFSMAKQEQAELLLAEGDNILNVLGTPRASYYPTYLQDRATWDTDGSIISGIKRYPIKPRYNIGILEIRGNDLQNYRRKFGNLQGTLYESNVGGRKLIPRDATNNEINFDTVTQMNPLKEGATFSGSVHFHNLKPEELGALLSAMTFHGQEAECKHSLGQAKSHGYGSVSITINNISVSGQSKKKEDYLDDYESIMNQYVQATTRNTQKKWKDTKQLRELFAMARGFSDESLIDIFTSMMLDEFGKAKGEYMRGHADYSLFSAITLPSQQKVLPSQKKEVSVQKAKAKVSLMSGRLKQARLVEGKDTSPKELVVDSKVRLKVGDIIEVEKILSGGGNVQKLKFVKK